MQVAYEARVVGHQSRGEQRISWDEQLNRLGQQDDTPLLIMNRAHQGEETRRLTLVLGYKCAVPSWQRRVEHWQYGREMVKRNNEIEPLFRRLKEFRRIISRFE